jgi:hypothetical protein
VTPSRFWSKVNRTNDCWFWTGNTNDVGYGRVRVGRHLKAAHRIAWELTNGPIPDGAIIRHRCRRPGCVRPDHLVLVTDIVKLSPRNVEVIRRSTWTYRQIRAHFRISLSRISQIKRTLAIG